MGTQVLVSCSIHLNDPKLPILASYDLLNFTHSLHLLFFSAYTSSPRTPLSVVSLFCQTAISSAQSVHEESTQYTPLLQIECPNLKTRRWYCRQWGESSPQQHLLHLIANVLGVKRLPRVVHLLLVIDIYLVHSVTSIGGKVVTLIQ